MTRNPQVLRRLTLAAAALALVLAAVLARPAAAATTIGGGVMCAGSTPVVGVWVDQASGPDGWAQRWSNGAAHYNYWRYYNSNGGNYRVVVGCGGTPQRWASSNSSGWVRGWHEFTCYDPWSAYWAKNWCQVTG